jgi:hypothetical protein
MPLISAGGSGGDPLPPTKTRALRASRTGLPSRAYGRAQDPIGPSSIGGPSGS